MSTYLDRLSMMTNEDEDDDKLSNEYQMRLCELLFSHVPYVMLIMNYKNTGHFDMAVARKCILHIWKNSGGIADMKHCCMCFAESLDDLLTLGPKLQPMFTELIDKYSNM